MKVKCIEAKDFLLEGRVYDAEPGPDLFGKARYMITDKGRTWKRRLFFASRFEVVPELVGKKADLIITDEIGWDTATRGPRMANPTARAILKYAVPTLEQFELSLPADAQLIRIDHIDGFTWAWAVVDTRKPLAKRKFRAFKTGATIPDDFDTSAYVGFYPIYVQMELGLYVFEDYSQ
ncbi:DUF7352 domain-containing protein